MNARYIFPLLVFLICGTAASQGVETGSRWIELEFGDSIRVEFALPSADISLPSMVLLPDRFGNNDAVRALLKIFAGQGFRTYAVPLRSAVDAKPAGYPETVKDSEDISVVAQVTVEILNEQEANGMAVLLGFDIGSNIGAAVASRIPLFKSCVFFYPLRTPGFEQAIADMEIPVLLHIAENDPEYSIEDVGRFRERALDTQGALRVRYYREAGTFFFNRLHENYHSKHTSRALGETLGFFRGKMVSPGRSASH